MPTFFSVDHIAFTVLGYPMSWVELLGTIFNLWSVWLVARKNILTWPVGLLGVVFFLILFYQIQLYSDTLEQVYYLFTSVYGWWIWSQRKVRPAEQNPSGIRTSSLPVNLTAVLATLLLTVGLGYMMSNLHLWWPGWFPLAADYPYLDALTTVMSFTATLLMAHKRVECWLYWIMVDVIGIGLYFAKDVKFVSLLYVIFLVLAINGLVEWMNTLKKPAATEVLELDRSNTP